MAKQLSEELQAEGKSKADAKSLVLQALTEGNLLKVTMKPRELTEMKFQLEMRKLKMQEREKREQRKYSERNTKAERV